MENDILRHQDVKTARRYFLLGFCGLPFIWIVNYCYFKHAISQTHCNPSVYLYVTLSKYFAIIAIAILIAWMIIFWVINNDSWNDDWYITKHETHSI